MPMVVGLGAGATGSGEENTGFSTRAEAVGN